MNLKFISNPVPFILAISFLFFNACDSAVDSDDPMSPSNLDAQKSAIEAVLDDFHLAASDADYDRYFGHLADESVFFGTDMTERWPKPEFQVYAKARFDTGTGWTYTKKERNIFFAPGGQTAWFDEVTVNATYGEFRGTGALILVNGTWKIVQYHLTLPVPNDLLFTLIDLIDDLPN